MGSPSPYRENDRRRYPRYTIKAKVYFEVVYEIKTKVRYQILNRDDKSAYRKYLATGKNISAQGIAFTSFKKLNVGDRLFLEVYPPGSSTPILMEGEVCWSESITKKQEQSFDTGVRLLSVEGKAVDESIYFDEENQVKWSIVLEKVIGTFRQLQQKLHEKKNHQHDNSSP